MVGLSLQLDGSELLETQCDVLLLSYKVDIILPTDFVEDNRQASLARIQLSATRLVPTI